MTDQDEMRGYGGFREPDEIVFPRAWKALMFLLDRPEVEIAVVTHSGFVSACVLQHPQVTWPGAAEDEAEKHFEMKNCELFSIEVVQTGRDTVEFRMLGGAQGCRL